MLKIPQFFDLNLTDKDQIFDKTIEGLPKNNDKYYVEHSDGSVAFTVKTEPKWKVKKER